MFQKVLASTSEERYRSCDAFVGALGDAVSAARIEEVWHSLRDSMDSGTLERFIRTYPDSSFAEIARRRLPTDPSIDDEWKILAANPAPIGIRTFLERYPNCPQFIRARALLQDLEARSWLDLGNHPTSAALDLFLRQFPDGRFAGQARAKLTSVLAHDPNRAPDKEDAAPNFPATVRVPDEPENPGPVLMIAGRPYPVSVGMVFLENDVPGLLLADADAGGRGAVAEVNVNPRNPSIIGLKNLSTSAWIRTSASGEVRTVDPGTSIHLAAGSTIQFGANRPGVTEGKVR